MTVSHFMQIAPRVKFLPLPWIELTFPSSIARLAFARSSRTLLNISSSFSSNFLFTPLFTVSFPPRALLSAAAVAVPPPLRALTPLPSSPIIVFSKSSTALLPSSSPRARSCSASSARLLSSSFSRRLISFRWASRLVTMHSRQKTSPFEAHATGSVDCWRQRLQAAKGRKESRFRRVAWEPHVPLRSERSWAVKNAKEVFLLPGKWSSALASNHARCAEHTVGHAEQVRCPIPLPFLGPRSHWDGRQENLNYDVFSDISPTIRAARLIETR